MDATERFAAAVAAPAGEMRLDVAAFCLAAHARPGVDVDVQCARLDRLAQGCPTPTFDGMRGYLFETLGFRGNTRDYGDPENSFLDSVLERRLGIPISLAVVMMEVGRRVGVPDTSWSWTGRATACGAIRSTAAPSTTSKGAEISSLECTGTRAGFRVVCLRRPTLT